MTWEHPEEDFTLTVTRVLGVSVFFVYDKPEIRDIFCLNGGEDQFHIETWQHIISNGDLKPLMNGIERAQKVLRGRNTATRSRRRGRS